MSTVIDLQLRILQTQQRIAALDAQLDALFRAGATAQAEATGAQIDQLNIELQDLRQRLITAQQLASLGTASSGMIARDDAVATVDRTQVPLLDPQILTPDGRIQTAPSTVSPTTAIPPVTEANVDSGTDAPVRTISQTQATPVGPGLIQDPRDADAQAGGFYGGGIAPPTTQIGFGAGSEDSGTRNPTRVEIDNIFTETNITPRPNVLDQYASYTYVASVYLVPSEQYKQMMETKRKNLAGSALLFQSGGAPVTGRNPYFTNDYYIDNFEIKSFILGQGTGMTHNAKEINMTVVEPNGITLIDNLTRAVNSFFPDPQKKKDITSVIYLMVIRFYGYDDAGNLVRGGVTKPNGSSDPNAFVEKWFPFIIKDIKFKIHNKLVEYDISAAAPHFQINAGVARGTIPFNIELSGQTIKDLLSGPVQYGNNQASVSVGGNNAVVPTETYEDFRSTAPPKANAAPSPKTTIRQGLMAALNEHQRFLVESGKQRFADEYSIEFVGATNAPSAIEQAKLRPPGGLNKSATSMAVPKTAAEAKLGSKQSMDPNTRTQSATAGLQIVQFLDQVLRNSTYLKDQQLVEVDEATGEIFFNGTPAQNVAWFKISLEATAKLDQWDDARNQYAYKIKYIVSPYRLSQLNSKYFPTPKFTGVQKEYKYWFTGENTSVLSYEENINGLYYLTLSGANFNLNGSYKNESGEQIKFNYQTNSTESNQGAEGQTNEIVANAAEQLLQPGSVKEANMTIVGDPAWLQQGEASLGQLRNQWNFGSFMPDGTINFDGGQVLFRVAFNAPADYNTQEGIVRPGLASSVAPGPAPGSPTGPAQINRVYIATKVTSNFSKGRFTQQLTGSLLLQQTTADNQAALATQFNQQQQAVFGMSNNRQPSGAVLLSSLSTPAYSTGGIINQALNISTGVNQSQFGQNLLASYNNNNILGGITARPVAIPGVPTSSGLPVGLVNSVLQAPSRLIAGATNTITNTVNQVLSSSERNIRGVLDSVSTGATQLVAPSDDSGSSLVQSPTLETAYVSPIESDLISEPVAEFNANNDFFG
jgi:hypothetical protein